MGEGGRRDGVISCMWSAFDWVNVGCVDVFFTYGENMVLVLRGVGNGYGIYGQSYVASFQGSEMSVGLYCRNFILGYNVLGYRNLM